MYIAPDSTIKILKNVPLDPTYDHTIFFLTSSNQYAFFNSKVKYTFTDQTYQRVNKGVMRVKCRAENLYDCNYIMFQNTAFGTKWFYAFIKAVEYVNNEVSEVTFEIDVMQTWFFDYTLDQCFVEREHSSSDNAGDNIVVEDLNLGNECVCNNRTTYDMNDMSVCIFSNRKIGDQDQQSQTINSIYAPIRVTAGVSSLNPAAVDASYQDYFDNNPENILCVFQYPTFLGSASQGGTTVQKTLPARPIQLDGYTPRNKKLYTHPYNYIIVSNNCGNIAVYKFESWKYAQDIGKFNISGVYVTSPCVVCYPLNYRGIPLDFDDGIVYSNFPQCPYPNDAFKAWWAQNKNTFATGQLASAVTGLTAGAVAGAKIGASAGFMMPGFGNIAGGAAGAVIGGIIGAGAACAASVARKEDMENAPSQTRGQVQTDSLNAAIGRVRFDFYFVSIKKEYARIIDEYFDRFGYATKRNKIPNRNVRPHWCYTKTIGCTLTGSIPCDDAAKICKIYDNGITFWKNGNEVGNYALDNTISGSIIPEYGLEAQDEGES